MNKNDEKWIRMMNAGHVLGCHQMATRSFFYRGYQFPVCARCTGVIVGELIAVCMILMGVRIHYRYILIMLGIMGIDWFIQRINIKPSTNLRRLITGICGGAGVTYIYFYGFRFIICNI